MDQKQWFEGMVLLSQNLYCHRFEDGVLRWLVLWLVFVRTFVSEANPVFFRRSRLFAKRTLPPAPAGTRRSRGERSERWNIVNFAVRTFASEASTEHWR